MIEAAATVHTSGINWESVITIVGSVVTVLSVVFGLIARSVSHYVANKITQAIDKLRIDVIDSMDKRVTSLEAFRESTERKTRR